ncbi:YgiT-type zinc finger protein [Pseudoduganella violacea]|uniref:YgiT-type zinc finger protein n=1 Tax=Pseudoduganella violacea TaxID=1715466 RepID=UPI00161AE537|nr:YgiT-type zinc finger protein [Pseudoduganella violacea]
MDGTLKPLSSSDSTTSPLSSSPSTLSDAPCVYCGEVGLEVRRVIRHFGRNEHLLLIENIPLYHCPHCAADYFSAQTMHEIERIKSQRLTLAVPRSVPIAEFRA